MKKTLILVIVLISICACGKIECPAFPDDQLSWVNYETGDIVSFKSVTDTLSHSVETHYKTEEHSYPGNCDCACDASAGFKTQSNKRGYKIIANCSYYNDDNFCISYEFCIPREIDERFGFEYNNTNNTNQYVSAFVDYEFNGEILSSVGLIEKLDHEMIIKIYFTKEKGLIAFVDKDGTEWQLIE